nr:hypothetical protein CFP56_11638 [Quercus suber]
MGIRSESAYCFEGIGRGGKLGVVPLAVFIRRCGLRCATRVCSVKVHLKVAHQTAVLPEPLHTAHGADQEEASMRMAG